MLMNPHGASTEIHRALQCCLWTGFRRVVLFVVFVFRLSQGLVYV